MKKITLVSIALLGVFMSPAALASTSDRGPENSKQVKALYAGAKVCPSVASGKLADKGTTAAVSFDSIRSTRVAHGSSDTRTR